MAVLVLIWGEKYEYLLVQSRQVHLKEELGQAFFLFLFLRLFFQPCPCMSTTLIFFMFFSPFKISGVKGLSEGQAQRKFSRPKADIPRKWFSWSHVH